MEWLKTFFRILMYPIAVFFMLWMSAFAQGLGMMFAASGFIMFLVFNELFEKDTWTFLGMMAFGGFLTFYHMNRTYWGLEDGV